jgi:hypothetical protein
MPDTKTLFAPQMPDVDILPDIESVFAKARKAADESREDEDGLFHRQVIIVTPGRLLISKICPLPSEIPADELSRLVSLIPLQPSRNISVIAFTLLDALKADILKAIPFFGFLLGFATLGHKVVVFEGHSSALSTGCRDADLLLVDAGMLPYLDEKNNWQDIVLKVMKGKDIKIIAR